MSIFYYSLFCYMLYLLELNLASIVRRNCIAQCSFQMSFDDQLERPLNCSEQILSYTCVVRITILYNTRTIFVYFRTTGFEHNENELSLYTIQQVSHIFQRNHSSYVIIFACIFADNCDWIYTRDIINRFTRVNYTLMFIELKFLLYDNSNTSVLQCYSQNNIIDCNNGICSSIISESKEFTNRSCIHSSNSNIGIDIRRYRGFPALSDDDQNYNLYLCNRNLCNNPTTEYSVRSIIQLYSSLLDIPEPSKTVVIWKGDIYYYIAMILLFHLL